jgi:predicted metalloprotease with PDZ domain
MLIIVFVSILVTCSSMSSAPANVTYTLSYNNTESTIISINIQFPINKSSEINLNGTQTFIMPRSVPSGYNLQFYDSYVDNLEAKSVSGNDILITKESIGGPRWTIECSPNETLSSISYSIDLAKQEQGILSAGDSSKIRPHRYIGILGYSVYGYLEQMDKQEYFPIMLIVQSPPDWPIHLTLLSDDRLSDEQAYGTTYGIAKNYYHLADSQVYMGPNISLEYISIPLDEFYQKQGNFSLYVIVYREDLNGLDINMVVDLSTQAMKNLLLYYNNNIPFLFYTVAMEMVKPLDEQHSYGFSMEHLYSCTINVQYGSGINQNSTKDTIKRFQYNIAHHIQHAWLPKRLFSNFYYPFTFELTPVIDTIWFNEVCLFLQQHFICIFCRVLVNI